jgi:hypothetical protein
MEGWPIPRIGTPPCGGGLSNNIWRGGRVVEGARLESVLGASPRRFKSCPLRHY